MSPVSLQLSPALSEGRPQPGVPRGVVAHSSGSRNHDAFCRGRETERRLEVEWWRGRWGIPIRWENKESLSDNQWTQPEEWWSLSYAAAVWWFISPALTDWSRIQWSPPCQTWSRPPDHPGWGLWAFCPSDRWCSDGRSYHTGRAPKNRFTFISACSGVNIKGEVYLKHTRVHKCTEAVFAYRNHSSCYTHHSNIDIYTFLTSFISFTEWPNLPSHISKLKHIPLNFVDVSGLETHKQIRTD